VELPGKPSGMFDRDDEWNDLARFAMDDAAGATLGVVSGRRRQGKTMLLYSLAQATGGLYFAATEATEADSLRRLGQVIADHVGAPAPLRGAAPGARAGRDQVGRADGALSSQPAASYPRSPGAPPGHRCDRRDAVVRERRGLHAGTARGSGCG
jgi:hypothetical protein